MRSRRPYLLRAMYEWMVDTRQTPYLLVDARQDGVQVPQGSVHEGRIVLNVGPSAVNHLVLGNEDVEFDARFGGVSRHVVAPVRAVLAIYSRESGQGMMFGLDDETAVEAPAIADGVDEPAERPALDGDKPGGDKPGAPRRGRPSLKVVK